jgi:hypothetical protein
MRGGLSSVTPRQRQKRSWNLVASSSSSGKAKFPRLRNSWG